jgi:hypothetical protein
MAALPLPSLSNCIRTSVSNATHISNCPRLTLKFISVKTRTALTKGGEKAKENQMGQTIDRERFGRRNPQRIEYNPGNEIAKGQRQPKGKGNRKSNEPCSHCNIAGHFARDCDRLQRDEKAKQNNETKKPKEMKQHVLIADETNLLFKQGVVHADKIEEKNGTKPMRRSPPENANSNQDNDKEIQQLETQEDTQETSCNEDANGQ